MYAFQHTSTILRNAYSSPNPKCIATLGLASFAFARHYLRNLGFDFSSSWYLDVSVPKVPLIYLCIQYMIYGSSPYVFPHSEICGSRLICSSPQLIAACHVFLRLLMPRHSPCALVCLNFFCLHMSFNICRSLSSLFKNCWVHLNSFWFLISPSFHNYLCFDFSKIVFLPLIQTLLGKTKLISIYVFFPVRY